MFTCGFSNLEYFYWCDLPHWAVFIIFVIYSAIKRSIFFSISLKVKSGFEPTSEDHGSDCEFSAFTTRPGGSTWFLQLYIRLKLQMLVTFFDPWQKKLISTSQLFCRPKAAVSNRISSIATFVAIGTPK